MPDALRTTAWLAPTGFFELKRFSRSAEQGILRRSVLHVDTSQNACMAIRNVKPETCVRAACLSGRDRDRRAPVRRLLALGIATYLTASCATTGPSPYLEPPMPEDETAWFLVRRPQSLWSEAAVQKIDGLEVRYTLPFQGSWSRMTWSLKVTPGEHHIDCLYVPYTPLHGHLTLVSFVVDFSKGQSYSILGRSDDDKVQIWVEDTETGQIAGMGTVALGEN